MRKRIYNLLDFLLILGAIASIATIDGGRWLSTGMGRNQPVEGAWYDMYALQAAYEHSESTARPESSTLAASTCTPSSAPAFPEWDDNYLLLSAYYHAVGNIQDTLAGLGVECS